MTNRPQNVIACFCLTAIVWLAIPLSAQQSPDARKSAKTAAEPSDKPQSASSERFDDQVRDDFFAGMRGDQKAFDRAMKLCDDTLAKDPKHPAAMEWHGNGLVAMASKAFQAGDVAKGLDLWQRGLKEMDDAVALAPDSLQVLIPRGATLLGVAKYVPDPTEAKKLLKTGVGDYEKVLQLQSAIFGKLSKHSRGELLFGIADGWYQLGENEKSRDYLRRIADELAGTEYAVQAKDWLDTKDSAALQKKSKALTCIGCHDGP